MRRDRQVSACAASICRPHSPNSQERTTRWTSTWTTSRRPSFPNPITMWSAILAASPAGGDPVRALANIHHCLKPDGIFVLNHFDVDSVPGRILQDRHFEYNHASLVIYSKKTMGRCLNQARFDVVYLQNERQYASLGRIAGYLKRAGALKSLRALGLEDATIPIIVPGTIFV